jgi:two-component system phosphate regulon response regulator PhoB
VDRAAHRAWVDGEEVAFTALELRLLVMLYDRRGRVLTRDLLLDEVWGSHVDVTARNVDTHVKRVREKLGVAGEYIETVRGVGYRFRSDASDDGGSRSTDGGSSPKPPPAVAAPLVNGASSDPAGPER